MSVGTVIAVDTVLRRARTAGGALVDIAVRDGRIAALSPSSAGAIEPGEHDLGGRLVMSALAEPHAHLDKALLSDSVPNRVGDLQGAIDAMVAAAAAGRFTTEDLIVRATAALDRLVRHGVTAVRTHIDTGDGPGASNVAAMAQVRRAFDGIVDVQIVALTFCPITGAAGAANRAALTAALDAGADLVGGCPHLDPDPAGSIEVFLDAARDAGVGLDLHMDETLDPAAQSLAVLARRVIERAHPTAVSASHCVSLAMHSLTVQRTTAQVLAEAGISVIPLPQTNLFLQGRGHHVAMPRAITPIDVLRAAGVNVAAGGDNVQDPFNPVGRSDPLETAALLVMATHQLPHDALQMVSGASRRAMGLAEVTLAPGDPADLLAIDATGVANAIADASADRLVFKAGRLVASTTVSSVVHR